MSSGDNKDGEADDAADMSLYDLPFVTNIFSKIPFLKYVPCCPAFTKGLCTGKCRRRRQKKHKNGSCGIEEEMEACV